MNNLFGTNKPNICVITSPNYQNIQGATPTILSNFVKVLERLSNELFIITGKFPSDQNKRIHIMRITGNEKREFIIITIIKFVIIQLNISYYIFGIYENIDLTFFFLGTRTYLLPMLLLKLLKKKTVIIVVGPMIDITYKENLSYIRRFIIHNIVKILGSLNYALADKIIVYSRNSIDMLELKKYKNKILVAPRHFINLEKFTIKKKFSIIDNLVGFIGRLSEEKGILNFVRAIQEILEEKNETRFLIGGDGPLRDKINKYLEENNLNDKVKLTGWISHDELPGHLNELKLLVLPSYTEGLPNIMLEAMACGIPVLATPVGSIPDIIKDGDTGFIMENNSPKCIAENVINALNYPNLDKIVKNARMLVEEEFTHEAAIERFSRVISEHLGD